MLETVREFAAEQFADGTDLDVTRDAHSRIFLRLVEHLPLPPAAPDRAGLDALELEHDNLRAALDHLSESEPGTALRAANRLTGFWSIRGHFSGGTTAAGGSARSRAGPRPRVGRRPVLRGLARDRPGRPGGRAAAARARRRARESGRRPGAGGRGSAVPRTRPVGHRRPVRGWDDIERSLALREAFWRPCGSCGRAVARRSRGPLPRRRCAGR